MKTADFTDFFKADLKSPSWLYNWLETHSGSFRRCIGTNEISRNKGNIADFIT